MRAGRSSAATASPDGTACSGRPLVGGRGVRRAPSRRAVAAAVRKLRLRSPAQGTGELAEQRRGRSGAGTLLRRRRRRAGSSSQVRRLRARPAIGGSGTGKGPGLTEPRLRGPGAEVCGSLGPAAVEASRGLGLGRAPRSEGFREVGPVDVRREGRVTRRMEKSLTRAGGAAQGKSPRTARPPRPERYGVARVRLLPLPPEDLRERLNSSYLGTHLYSFPRAARAHSRSRPSITMAWRNLPNRRLLGPTSKGADYESPAS
ncbi:uncharacterized protein LOC119508837 [Choloepus didactylus]|uniref:uncharacterized protein LOC119508837 n=1 Tax=Choloepus didactylus TaxID=27675 RepID=UPI00189F515A|nr:uncharacterized protein LOC119508837 [Choloepus didactylus]